MEEPNIIAHDKLEPPIKRKTGSDYFWDKYSFYDKQSNTIHIINAEVMNDTMIIYQKAYADKLQSNKWYQIGLVSPNRFILTIVTITIASALVAILAGLWNLSILARLFGDLFLLNWMAIPFYLYLRTRPKDLAVKTARQYLKNPA